ncbi:MAG: hydrogenase iron-sulfur subunit [Promethearchaeota archaeon]
MTELTEFEPKILGFLCNWCSYAGADLAGVSRIQYPPNIRVLRVMCSGRVDPSFVVEALKGGLDGVIILGCHLNDCHYMDGNFEEERKIAALVKLLALVNMDDRIKLDWVSASEGGRFGELVTEFTDHIKKLGPSPLSAGNVDEDLKVKMEAVERVTKDQRFRTLIARERKITTQGNVYGEIIEQERYDEIVEEAILDEFSCQEMLLAMEKEPKSVKDMAKKLKIESSKVLQYVVKLKGNGLIDLSSIENVTPYYKAI